uniref:Uncharacterized protein n=1 Tax=Cannabis sativa TaxID=3483 RepID=A0A803Q7Q1_CANSA
MADCQTREPNPHSDAPSPSNLPSTTIKLRPNPLSPNPKLHRQQLVFTIFDHFHHQPKPFPSPANLSSPEQHSSPNPTPEPAVMKVVKEFYTNFLSHEWPTEVIVHEIEVSFSAEAINNLFELEPITCSFTPIKGTVLAHEILDCAHRGKGKLFLPATISSLCRDAGVPMWSEEGSLNPKGPISFCTSSAPKTTHSSASTSVTEPSM